MTAPALPPAAVTVVLVRPRYAENVGAVARALANFDGGDLRLVDPNELTTGAIARRVAKAGEERLDRAACHATLDEALADVDLSIATSHRAGRHRHPLTPWELAALIPTLAPRRVALVLGPEDSGLKRNDLDRCDRLVSVPSRTPLNLAQAAILLLYELCVRPAADRAPSQPAAEPSGAIPRIVRAAEEALPLVGYPHHRKPLKAEMAKLADILARAAPNEWEASFLVGMFNTIRIGIKERTDGLNGGNDD